jgi:hypothetical protein
MCCRFMDLARASSALTAKRGAAVGVARIARLAATAAGGGEEVGLMVCCCLGWEGVAVCDPVQMASCTVSTQGSSQAGVETLPKRVGND